MSNLVQVLTPLWERVFGRAPIAADDNFFDLGGDSRLALQLFAEITREIGRAVPAVLLYQAPTIKMLAAALELPRLPPFAPLVLLKNGSPEIPFFITHGMGGNLMDFFQLVKHIESPRAIYGMQPKGLDGVEEPFDRIEDMAQYFLDAIRQIQLRGPYFLTGYSLGGLVVFEMAQRLVAKGEKVALLALIDSYPQRSFLPVNERIRFYGQRLWRRATTILQAQPVGASSRASSTAPANPAPHSSAESSQPLPLDAWFPPAILRMENRAQLALERYQPRHYSGKIQFAQAETLTEFPDNPYRIWSRLSGGVQLDTVPGDHLEIIKTNFKSLGRLLSRYLEEASQAS